MKPKFEIVKDRLHVKRRRKPKSTLEAIEWSIAKWQFLVKKYGNKKRKEVIEDGGKNTCAFAGYL